MSEEKEAFLDRWSRLKREQPEEKPAVPETKQEAAAPLPPVEGLKPDSDFTPYMDPRVADDTRRSALKKLFSDAHFNTPDPFEPFSGDWNIAEPIPPEMLKQLEHAKEVLFGEEEEQKRIAERERLAQKEKEESKAPDEPGRENT